MGIMRRSASPATAAIRYGVIAAAALLGILAAVQVTVTGTVPSVGGSTAHAVTAPGPAGAAGPGVVVTGHAVVVTGHPGLPLLVIVALALATTVPLGPLWRWPLAAALVTGAACALSLGGFGSLTLAGVAAELVALYRLGRRGGPVLATVVLTAPFAVLALGGTGRGEPQVLAILLAAGSPLAAWAGADRRARAQAAADQASREAIAGDMAEHGARGERARISRELHDVVAHHISMIAVQAETARLATPGMPAAGAQRLSAIGDTARDALTEMRRLLGVLREDTGPAPASRLPQPGLPQLSGLLDEARAASGTFTRLIVSGPPAELDPGVELAAYRIVQEALTNARRHAPGAAVDVELRFRPDNLLVLVRDNGPGPAAVPPGARPAGGLGLVGMRERAAAVGGVLHTGPASGGGFLVAATLPARSADRTPATRTPATRTPADRAPATPGRAAPAPATRAPAIPGRAAPAPATRAPADRAPATPGRAAPAPATRAPASPVPASPAPASPVPARTGDRAAG
jgi:signal transduction histidine kinase